MAEKKVGGRKKNNDTEKKRSFERISIKRDADYDEFTASHANELRKRSTVISQERPERRDADESEPTSARCSEIDPHTTTNPALSHQIMTKRTGTVLSDDTGFKAQSYDSRFEPAPELAAEPQTDESELIAAVPGQQTMSDLLSEDESDAPVESNISPEEAFAAAYEEIKTTNPEFGKAEKLRAIARTAQDDGDMQPESQLAFPAFDPLFKFPSQDEDKKSREKPDSKKKKRLKGRNKKNEEAENTPTDIGEEELVINMANAQSANESAQAENEEKAEKSENSPEEKVAEEGAQDASAQSANEQRQQRLSRIFELITENEDNTEKAPRREITEPSELAKAAGAYSSVSKSSLIKTAVLFFLGVLMLLLSFVFDASPESTLRTDPPVYMFLNFISLLIGAGVCIKELADGVKDIIKKRFSLNASAAALYAAVLLQNIAAGFASSSVGGYVSVLAPSALLMLMSVTLPNLFLSKNTSLTLSSVAAKGHISLLRASEESGIDGTLADKYAFSAGRVRYKSETGFPTGIMARLTNAIPKPYGANAVFIFSLFFAVICGVASGLIESSALFGITSFALVLAAGLQISYSALASFTLMSANSSLAKKGSSLLSYRCAGELTKTKAFVFDALDIIDSQSCSVHGTKLFGNSDPIKTVLYCACIMKAGASPLAYMLEQIVTQHELELPEAHDVRACTGGLRAEIDGRSVMLGSREFLSSHGVAFPDEDFEEKYLSGDRKMLYLAVDRSLAMLLTVSYYVKRSAASFFKALTKDEISIVLYTSDPNLTVDFITKKCKLKSGYVFIADDSEAAYFTDKASRVDKSAPADVFTDGTIEAASALYANAKSVTKLCSVMTYAISIMSIVGMFLIAIAVFLGGGAGNAFILFVKALSAAVGAGAAYVALIKSKRS